MKLFLLFLLSLGIVSCAPPYNAELNSSAGLADQMNLLGTIGPVKSPDGSSTTAIRFLPIKPTSTTTSIDQLNVASGFLVTESPGREGLSFAFEDSGGKVQVMNIGASFPLAGADPNYPLYEYDVATTTTTANILVLRLDGASPANNTLQFFTAALPTGPLQGAATNPQYLNAVYGSQTPLAVQNLPSPVAPYDTYNFLFTNGSIDSEIATPFSGTSFGTGVFSRNAMTLPSGIGRMLYYRSADNLLSYFGYHPGGQWIWSRWDGSASLSLTGVTHRIDAILTDGDLISTDGGTLRIYDPGGSQVTSVPLGAMQFCHEAYVGTTPYVFFSVTLDFPHETWAFRVYAIPTSELRSLKG